MGKNNTVLVTGIGGNVGYGILMILRGSFPNLKIIGTNTEKVSAGNHLCDEVFEVPFALNTDYLPLMHELYKRFEVDLVIPTTDYECFVLSTERDVMNIAVSPPEVSRIFLDKYLTFKKLSEIDLAFAESILPSEYNGQFEDYVVKPREGRGSRGLFYNPPEPGKFSDENIIQPLLRGTEITAATYITRDNRCHGFITMERQLNYGTTYQCQVVREYDHLVSEYFQKLTDHLCIRGSFNMQAKVVDGKIIPFEFNCRISGTNSIRFHFGFRDVEYTINEYLYNKEPEPVILQMGSAIRILYDIIYPGISLKEIENKHDHFFIYNVKDYLPVL